MAINSYAHLIHSIFAPVCEIAIKLKHVRGVTDPDVAARYFDKEVSQCWRMIGQALERLGDTKQEMPAQLRESLDWIAALRRDAENQCISYGDLVIFLACRSRQLDDAAQKGWIAAKHGGNVSSVVTQPDHAGGPPKDAPTTSPRSRQGRVVSREKQAIRETVVKRWQRFQSDYSGLGYSKASYEFFTEWACNHFEDMPTNDPAEIKRIIEAHRKTPSPKPTEE